MIWSFPFSVAFPQCKAMLELAQKPEHIKSFSFVITCVHIEENSIKFCSTRKHKLKRLPYCTTVLFYFYDSLTHSVTIFVATFNLFDVPKVVSGLEIHWYLLILDSKYFTKVYSITFSRPTQVCFFVRLKILRFVHS